MGSLRAEAGRTPYDRALAGDLDLEYDALEIPADPGQTIIAYSAEPGSAAHQALGILVSWAATNQTGQLLDTTHSADGHSPVAPRHLPLYQPSELLLPWSPFAAFRLSTFLILIARFAIL